jgi:hypothetical protein
LKKDILCNILEKVSIEKCGDEWNGKHSFGNISKQKCNGFKGDKR